MPRYKATVGYCRIRRSRPGIADIARALDEAPVWFLDDKTTAVGTDVVISGPIRSQIPRHIATHRYVVAIGATAIRRELSEMILAAGGELATLVHPTAVIAPDVTIGAGTVIMAGAIVNTGTRIARFAVVNTGAILDHDNIVEDNVHVSPGCVLAGRVACRRDSSLELAPRSFLAWSLARAPSSQRDRQS